jgi:hypothetical protein
MTGMTGMTGKKFYRTAMQLVPEVFIIELESQPAIGARATARSGSGLMRAP